MEIEIIHTPTVRLVHITRSPICRIGKMFKVVYRVGEGDEMYNTLLDVVGDAECVDYRPDDFDMYIFREVLNHRHSSVLEFIDTLWFVECSRVTSHQVVRHRVASYWQESQRYRTAKPRILVPRSIAVKDILETLYRSVETYLKHVHRDNRQLVRYILPQAVTTRLFIKMNLREITEVFIPLRMCRRAQPEIRYIAIRMYMKLVEIFPELSKFTGPRCVIFGRCLEYGYEDEEQCRKCREVGYIEAIQEHGTDKEIENINEILKKLP